MPKNNARKVKLGQRWVCYECAARFYDLNRPEPLCPKCKADQRESPAFAKPKRGRRKKAAQAPPAVVVEEPPVVAEAAHPMDPDLDPDPGFDNADTDPDDAPLEDEFEHV